MTGELDPWEPGPDEGTCARCQRWDRLRTCPLCERALCPSCFPEENFAVCLDCDETEADLSDEPPDEEADFEVYCFKCSRILEPGEVCDCEERCPHGHLPEETCETCDRPLCLHDTPWDMCELCNQEPSEQPLLPSW